MTSITEWFIFGFSTPAENDPIPDLILFAICGFIGISPRTQRGPCSPR
nr:hypothetical protein [Methanosarcina flavescens]